MKVLSHGTRPPQPDWSKAIACAGDGDGCGATLEVGLDDIYEVYRPQPDDAFYGRDGRDIRQYVCCPDCGTETVATNDADSFFISVNRRGTRPKAADREALKDAFQAQRGAFRR